MHSTLSKFDELHRKRIKYIFFSKNIIERIQLAKEKRLRIGGRNQHPQCDQILSKKSIYYLHLKILLKEIALKCS